MSVPISATMHSAARLPTPGDGTVASLSERCHVGDLPGVSRSKLPYDFRALEKVSIPNGFQELEEVPDRPS